MATTANNAPKVSADTLGHLFNLSARRVQQLAKEGVIPKPVKRDEYLLAESVRGYTKWLQDRVQHRDTANVSRDLREEQLRKIKTENDLADGLLISIDDVQQSVALMGNALVRLCESLRGRLTPLIAPYLREGVDSSFLPGVIDDEQRRIRTEIAETLESLCGPGSVRENNKAPAPKDVGRVGRRTATTT